MKILLVLEDPTLDSFIAEPIVERLVKRVPGRHRVQVMRDPRFRGETDALDPERLAVVLQRWRWRYDLMVLIVDRDRNRLSCREVQLAVRQTEAEVAGFPLIGQCAIQELEVWLLAAFHDQLGVQWSDVRAECDPKERFFDPLVEQLEVEANGPRRGRKPLMALAAGRFKAILGHCPEVDHLGQRLVRFLRSEEKDPSVYDYARDG